jgi:hypothetical protein
MSSADTATKNCASPSPKRRNKAVYAGIRDLNDHNNARVFCARRIDYFRKIDDRAALALLPSIDIIPIGMTVREFESIRSDLIEKSIPRSEYVKVFRTVRFSIV